MTYRINFFTNTFIVTTTIQLDVNTLLEMNRCVVDIGFFYYGCMVISFGLTYKF